MAWAGQLPQLQLQQQQHHLQQQQQQLQQQQLQLQQQQQQQQHQHQQQLQRQQQQLLQQQQQQQQQQLQQQQQQQQEPLAAYFHLLPLINAFADSVDRGIRDQHVEDLTNDLINRFDKCQEILNSISCSTNPKAMTLHSQRQKREEFENQLNQRRELMNKYRIMVEKAVGSTV